MARPNGYALDTNIVVSLARDNVLGKYLDRTYQLTTGGHTSALPVVVIGELRALSLTWSWGPVRRARLANIISLFLPLDIHAENVLDAYATIDTRSAACGKDMGKNDLWIAAVAHVHDLTLLTADADFDHIHKLGLIVVEWVDPAST
jgi:predicted nucleic acid-binding protein